MVEKKKEVVVVNDIKSTDPNTPRIGVYVCNCGSNIGGVINCGKVAAYAGTLPNVVIARENMYTCDENGQNAIRKDIKEHNLNRVVVAACSPKLHEPTFRRTVSEAGLNKYLFEMVNLREHNSWVHMREPELATSKAMEQVKMGIAKARLLEPLEDITVPVKKSALVIGGGVGGCQAALDLGDMDFDVTLVERELSIGGIMAQLDKTFPTMDCSICILGPKLVDVGRHSKIKLITNAEIESVSGFIGNFDAKVKINPRYVDMTKCDGCGACVDVCPVILPNEYDMNLKPKKAIYSMLAQAVPLRFAIDDEKCIKCGLCQKACEKNAVDFNQKPTYLEFKVGTIINAIGGDTFDARQKPEYGYGRHENVFTSMEFERVICASGPTGGHFIRPDGKHVKRAAFIQCVGSRDETCGRPYCSFYCCIASIKEARLIKEHDPDAEIYIFYMDMRTFGKNWEELYTRARGEGLIFIRGRPSEIRENPDNKNPIIVVENTLTGELMEVEVDAAILAVGIGPNRDSEKISHMLHIPRDNYGFFFEAHPKLRPVDTPVDGIFLAGTTAQPRDIKDSVMSGSACASRASIPMIAGKFSVEGIVTSLKNPELCKGCGICTTKCPYNALSVKEKGKQVEIVGASCKGCGTCIADCPFGALDQRHFRTAQINAQIDAALEEDAENKIISFNCNWCSYAGADLAGTSRFQYPTNVRIIRIMCAGRVSKDMVLRAFGKGANQVLVAPCHISDCHYISGADNATKRMDQLKKTLQSKGINPERFLLHYVSAAEGIIYQQIMKEMTEKIPQFKDESMKVKADYEAKEKAKAAGGAAAKTAAV